MSQNGTPRTEFWLELLLVVTAVVLLLTYWPPIFAWLQSRVPPPAVQTSGQDGCRAPTEHETLLISIGQRGSELKITGCSYAAGKGEYFRRRTQ